ncbi:GNAT family N-acetyltransferase [Nocardioides sp. JQ2195]|uniref:GNAT family N-acetyltransferase n=1 Tax=Nocardioides sp. JQ2195 TaxID=2592334 RepID=UPI00143EB1CB|nr:GNAT family N-acetyltransferase [Nocardioides sp. JQ2195]QIX26374.1 GNAT family N-acetyltransferase [Nocardioides sp. JQ2195]
MSSELSLRPATDDDLPAIATLYERARGAAVPQMPPPVHTSAQIRAWVVSWNLDEREVWVAEADRPVGFLALTEGWLESLYVEPSAQRSGVGSALLEVARSRRPQGFALWVFETNAPAREFYRRHGLIELECTDGADNEERSPDIRMAWPGEEPLDYLRGQIDHVDHDLGLLLARRAALTAAVQERKPVGGTAGRDASREQEIAERMARLAPALGVVRMGRIVDVIIAESLAAAVEDAP